MPIYNFRCDKCGKYTKTLQKRDIKNITCSCGNTAERQIPKELNSSIMEMRDQYRGVQLIKNHDKIKRERMIKHERKYNNTEKIEKYGINEGIKRGWTKE